MLIVETEQAKQSQWDGVWCGVNDEDNNNKKKNKGKKEDDDGGGKRFCVSVFVGWLGATTTAKHQPNPAENQLVSLRTAHTDLHTRLPVAVQHTVSPVAFLHLSKSGKFRTRMMMFLLVLFLLLSVFVGFGASGQHAGSNHTCGKWLENVDLNGNDILKVP